LVRGVSIYYRDDYVTLYHGDALWTEREWLDADVLVCDPPYGIDYRSNRPRASLARSIDGDLDTTVRDTILTDWGDRPALIFGTWRIPRPEGTRALLIWDTKGALGMGAMDIPWKPAHQEIYVLGRGFTGHRGSDVLSVAPVQSMAANGRLHPHQKPEALMKQLIAKCPPGVIADPTCGSGTTLVAAKALGRKAIGVESDEQYLEAIARRLDQGVLDFGEVGA
jgi:site-specific DNA-methyltransferase (adenine-specific)